MNKFIIFLFVLLAYSSGAQSCDNPLLKIYGIQGLDKPVSGAGLPFCGNLQNGQTCCSDQISLTLQGLIDSLIFRSLQPTAGIRDIYIAQLDHNYTSEFQNKVSSLTDLADEISDIQNANSKFGDQIHAQFLDLRQLGSKLHDFHHNNNFTQDFIDMQNKRATCFTTLLEIQGAAYCLACDPNWATLGVSTNGSITSAPALCTTIQDACAPFTAAMDRFNPLFQAQQAYQRLVDLIEYLKFFRENKAISNATISGDIFTSTNATERTNSEPSGCDENSCPWQCSNLFNGSFVMNTTIAGNGGGVIGMEDIAYSDFGVTDVSTRLLQDGSPIPLATWNPDLNVSQFVIVVVSDPAEAVKRLDKEIIDIHLGCSRLGFGLASLVILVNVAISIIM